MLTVLNYPSKPLYNDAGALFVTIHLILRICYIHLLLLVRCVFLTLETTANKGFDKNE
jgi:hypothetical protein